MNALLVSTYDLGRQPFGLASPAAWLEREGVSVRCLDLAVEALDEPAVRDAGLVGFYLPMHTATRIAQRIIPRVRALNPVTHLAGFGLYAAANREMLRALGVATVLGGEFEAGLARLARHLMTGSNGHEATPDVSLEKLEFVNPSRVTLPPLDRYARLRVGEEERLVGYTEASRGCRHLCRHCPIPPVYGGQFRVIQREVVLEDIRRQVARGARHITFGDPDFFNGPGHAIRIVEAMAREHPGLSYDVTIKIEHLLRHREHLPTLRDTGCAFVTSAAESVEDAVLERLRKHHTRADFFAVAAHMRAIGLVLHPTFVAFTPWTTPEGYRELLRAIASLDLVEHVSPVQLAIRLLIPRASLLLELEEVRERVGPYDEQALVHPWRHPDPRMDGLQAEVESAVAAATVRGEDRAAIFTRVWELAGLPAAEAREAMTPRGLAPPRAPVPFLTEPWYC